MPTSEVLKLAIDGTEALNTYLALVRSTNNMKDGIVVLQKTMVKYNEQAKQLIVTHIGLSDSGKTVQRVTKFNDKVFKDSTKVIIDNLEAKRKLIRADLQTQLNERVTGIQGKHALRIRQIKTETRGTKALMSLEDKFRTNIKRTATERQDATDKRIKRETAGVKALNSLQDKFRTNIKRAATERQNATDNRIKRETKGIKSLHSLQDKFRSNIKRTATEQKKLTAATNEFHMSWKSVGRILASQAIRRVMFEIVAGLRESVKTTIELFQKLSEVRTISQGMQLPFKVWKDEIVALSNAFGFDVLDQAEAAYQALSNQVVEGAETFKFLAEANRLAVTGLSTSAQSVNLLTSVINAFGFSIRDTEELAAKLFKTVELGRIRIADLADNMGGINVLASQLGVTFEELAATIAVFTIQGIKFSKANTQLRGILIKLLKPTKDMAVFIEEMGFASGEAAIQALGFFEVMNRLVKITKGSSTEIAKYISRIRGLSGQLIFVKENTGLFDENLLKIKNSMGSYGIATELVMKNAGKVVQLELNKIKNFFIQDFGTKVVEMIAFITKNIWSLSRAVQDLVAVIKALLIPVMVTVIGLAGKMALAFVFIHPIIAAATVAIGIAGIMIERMAGAQERAIEKIKKANAAWLKSVEDTVQKLKKSYFKDLDNFTKAQLKKIAEVRKGITFELKQIKLTLSGLENVAKAVGKGLADGIQQAKSALDKFDSSLFSIADRIRDLTLGLHLRGKTPQQKIALLGLESSKAFQRSLTFAKQGAVEEANKAYARSVKLAKTVKKINEEVIQKNKENAKDRKKLAEEILELDQEKFRNQNELFGKFRELSEKQRRAESIALIKQEEKSSKEIAALKVKESLLKDGRVFQIDFDREAIKGAKEYQAALLAGNNLIVARSRLQQAAHESFKEFMALENKEGATRAELWELAMKSGEALATVIADLEDLGGREKEIKALDALDDARYTKLLKLIKKGEVTDAAREIQNDRVAAKKTFEKLRPEIEKGSGSEVIKNLDEIRAAMSNLQPRKFLISAHEMGRGFVFDKLRQILAETTEDPTIDNLTRVLIHTKLLANLTKERAARGWVVLDREKLKKEAVALGEMTLVLIQNIKEWKELEKVSKKLQERVKDKDNINEVVPVGILSSMKDLIQAFDDLDKKIGRNRKIQGKASGGSVTDTIPAMLTPGEFVVNSKSARQFHSLLVAMNGLGMAQGGRVGGDTVSVGDINVSLNSSGNEQMDVMHIGKLINRGIRQKVINFS